jgi:hypothetical protein
MGKQKRVRNKFTNSELQILGLMPIFYVTNLNITKYFYRNNIWSKNIINSIKMRSTKTFLSKPVLIKVGHLIIFCK